jgi:hypothetical protein
MEKYLAYKEILIKKENNRAEKEKEKEKEKKKKINVIQNSLRIRKSTMDANKISSF